MKKAVALVAVAAMAYAATQHGGTASTIGASAPVAGGSNEALANSMAASGYGWTGEQTTCLDELWTEESDFDAYAANPTSDARGIPQNINGWSAGYQPGNAQQQVAWGLLYVKDRYGTPCAAWTFERSHTPNWY